MSLQTRINHVEFRILDKHGLAEPLRRIASMAALEILRDTMRAAPRDTGTLARSYTITEMDSSDAIVRKVGTNIMYAPFQEFGTRKMAARPHLGPSLESARRKYGR